MTRTKKLKASGIKKATLKRVAVAEGVEILKVTVVGPEDEKYKYEVYADQRKGTIDEIESKLKIALNQASSDYSKVEITEDGDRNYLHVEIQGSPIEQYSGKRLPN